MSGGCSARTVSMSTAKRDQKISECSTSRSLNQAKACGGALVKEEQELEAGENYHSFRVKDYIC